MKTRSLALAAAALFALGATAPACAAPGDWEFYIGAHHVNPKSDNGSLAGGALDVEIGSNTRPTFGFGYWLTDAVKLDLLAAVPFQHDLSLNGADAGDFRHLPPTLVAQYHFNPGGDVDPFVGLGLNYTIVYDEDPAGPIAGTNLELDNSLGLSAQLGLAYTLNESWKIAGDVRWFDLDSDVSVDGADVGTANVDPIAFGLFAIYTF